MLLARRNEAHPALSITYTLGACVAGGGLSKVSVLLISSVFSLQQCLYRCLLEVVRIAVGCLIVLDDVQVCEQPFAACC